MMSSNKIHWNCRSKLIMIAVLLTGAFGCSTQPFPPLEAVRHDLMQLKGDEVVVSKAPVALYDAEKAVKLADEAWAARSDQAEADYLAYLAKRKIEITKYTAQRKLIDDELTQLKTDREHLLLENKNREVQSALSKVQSMEEKLRQMEAEKAAQAKALADQKQAELEAQKKSLEEQLQELKELQSKKTERGFVVTIGDVLFSVGKADLKPGAQYNLYRLVTILKENAATNVLIEGHTDSMGSDEMNNELSMHRAQSVAAFLMTNGISAARITTMGYGKAYPVASNDDAAGRQMNRRVEVLLLNEGDTAETMRRR